jgi:hypothetical protein
LKSLADEMLAPDLLQSIQNVEIQDIPRTNLLFNHIETRFFKVHICAPFNS